MIMVDPDGKDAIYIVFPEYLINISGRNLPYLGHAGVLLIDNKTGLTKYYEYGRYDKEKKGIVRNPKIPNVKIGEDGNPTTESLNAVLEVISNKSGRNGKISGAYIKSDEFSSMNDYAQKEMKENSNPDRKEYSPINKNCATFATDVISQDSAVKARLPKLSSPIPTMRIQQYRQKFEPIEYHPKKK